MKKNVKALFIKNKGYLRRQQITDRTTYYHVLELVKSGEVDRVKRGVFHYNSASSNAVMVDIEKIVPSGVICLYSAWFFYELTVQIPQSFNVAVEKSRKYILPDYPLITLYYWKREYHNLGVVRKMIHGYMASIYDLEKSVCDAVKFRSKIGIEVSSEILKNYLKRSDRNLPKLNEYAKKMRVLKILRTYLEIQL